MIQKKEYTARLTLWTYCNFNCSFCIGARTNPPKVWDTINQKMDKLIDFLNDTGRWRLNLIGGEPVINPYFPLFCSRLIENNHKIGKIYTNATHDFKALFTKETMEKIGSWTISYHPIHEQNKHYHEMLEKNVRFCVENGYSCTINYVMLPDRIPYLEKTIDYFKSLGAQVSLQTLYGTYKNIPYPASYTPEELQIVLGYNQNIHNRYLYNHKFYISTFKLCQAGHRQFEIDLLTGRISQCVHSMGSTMFNYLMKPAEYFYNNTYCEPYPCPNKMCSCGFNLTQQQFAETHDLKNMDLYPLWEKISEPTAEAERYWKEIGKLFSNALFESLQGQNVYLYGAGIHTSKLLELLRDNGFSLEVIKGILDSNPDKSDILFGDIAVTSYKRFMKEETYKACSDIIISSAAYENEIDEKIRDTIGETVNIIRLYSGDIPYPVPI